MNTYVIIYRWLSSPLRNEIVGCLHIDAKTKQDAMNKFNKISEFENTFCWDKIIINAKYVTNF